MKSLKEYLTEAGKAPELIPQIFSTFTKYSAAKQALEKEGYVDINDNWMDNKELGKLIDQGKGFKLQSQGSTHISLLITHEQLKFLKDHHLV
jgi:hypothetical protein